MKKTYLATLLITSLLLGVSLGPLGSNGVAPLASQALAGEGENELYGRAISWLANQQHENGGFGQIPDQPPGEIGITALVVRGLADAPEPWKSKFREQATRAAEFILKHQQEDGSFTHERSGLTTYRTAIAIMALTSLDRERYAEPVARATQWLKGDQFDAEEGVEPNNPHYGGFGYDKGGEKPDADLSNTHLALAALKDAGIQSDDPVFKRALEFLSRCQNSSETNPGVGGLRPLDDGGFIYDPGLSRNKSGMTEHDDGTRSFKSYASMTYAGLLSLVHASGLGQDDRRVQAALQWIGQNYTLDENKGLGVRAGDPAGQQGLYYNYHSFAKCLNAVGQPTVETQDGPRYWAQDLFAAFKEREKEGGHYRNEHSRWWEQDPVLVTAYVVNAMNYALPYLPDEE